MTPEEKADLLHLCDLLAPAGDRTTTRLNGAPIWPVVKAARAYARAEAENERLQAYVEDWGSRLELSARCCRDAQARAERAEADANRLAGALRAFSFYEKWMDDHADDDRSWTHKMVTMGDLRAAKTALAEHDKLASG